MICDSNHIDMIQTLSYESRSIMMMIVMKFEKSNFWFQGQNFFSILMRNDSQS